MQGDNSPYGELAALMDDPDRADRIGHSAEGGVAKHFAAEVMTTQTVAAYEQTLRAGAGAGGPNRL